MDLKNGLLNIISSLVLSVMQSELVGTEKFDTHFLYKHCVSVLCIEVRYPLIYNWVSSLSILDLWFQFSDVKAPNNNIIGK